ncbi:phosphatase PAP2 family protein [Alkalihalobacillus sp. TS-13]|uniref:phosphatase PAP2 family protein n=1 Tax=Alkalihalobacillus sp. TS-13 TaxID=2842455 RepID=UPI001C889118|nr:phosphatase PAP2 family protein [Alkalihalobacillus sp. TS-13]
MAKVINWLHERECSVFQWVNSKCQKSALCRYFMSVTHLGGATGSIGICLLLLVFGSSDLRNIAVQSLLALTISHIPVQLSKKIYPRKRPYMVLPETITISRLLKDHSFPSGHTTATFSVTTPIILWNPLLSIVLLPISFSVAISRMYLGMHYPSDVIGGMLIGTATAWLVHFYFFPLSF